MEQATRDEGLTKIRSLIKKIDFCMLTTADEAGKLRSRPMAAQDPDEFAGQLWFFTYASSHKVVEVNQTHQVNVAFADPSSQNYVSMTGEATVVRDKGEIQRRWKPQYLAWFPDGLDDPDLALLRVDVESAEYWDSPSSVMAHVIGLVKTQVFGAAANVGENKSVRLQ